MKLPSLTTPPTGRKLLDEAGAAAQSQVEQSSRAAGEALGGARDSVEKAASTPLGGLLAASMTHLPTPTESPIGALASRLRTAVTDGLDHGRISALLDESRAALGALDTGELPDELAGRVEEARTLLAGLDGSERSAVLAAAATAALAVASIVVAVATFGAAGALVDTATIVSGAVIGAAVATVSGRGPADGAVLGAEVGQTASEAATAALSAGAREASERVGRGAREALEAPDEAAISSGNAGPLREAAEELNESMEETADIIEMILAAKNEGLEAVLRMMQQLAAAMLKLQTATASHG